MTKIHHLDAMPVRPMQGQMAYPVGLEPMALQVQQVLPDLAITILTVMGYRV